MRRIKWTVEARNDVRCAITFIAQDDPIAAQRVNERIRSAVSLLAESPIGHTGRVCGTYEKPIINTPYIVVYVLSDTILTILRLIHSSRNWPAQGWPE